MKVYDSQRRRERLAEPGEASVRNCGISTGPWRVSQCGKGIPSIGKGISHGKTFGEGGNAGQIGHEWS